MIGSNRLIDVDICVYRYIDKECMIYGNCMLVI